MRKWGLLLGAAAVTGAGAVVVVLALRHTRRPALDTDVPEIIDDCYSRIQRIEDELRRLRPPSENAA